MISSMKSSLPRPVLILLILVVVVGISRCSFDSSPNSTDPKSVAGIPASEFEPLSFHPLSPDESVGLREDDVAAKLASYDEPQPRTVTELISAEQGGTTLAGLGDQRRRWGHRLQGQNRSQDLFWRA